MKIDFKNGNLIVFLNKEKVSEIDFLDKCLLEKYFKSLFLKIDSIFNISLLGCYNVNVFMDEFYGAILEIIKDDDCFDCYNVIDMNICISEFTGFVYKIDNAVMNLEGNYYLYNDSIYFEPKFNDFITLGFLIENSSVVYGVDSFRIKKNGVLLDIDKTVLNMYN